MKENLWQSTVWKKFQTSLGKKCWDIQTATASALVVEQQIWKKTFLEIPRGPLGTPDAIFWKKVTELARKTDAIFVRFSSEKEQNIDTKKKKRSYEDVFPETTLLLDISKTEEEILAQMKQKGRYNIRLAEKKGVFVEKSNDIEAFSHLMDITTVRDGFRSYGAPYFKKMLKIFGSKAQLFLATYQKEPLAGALVVFLKKTAVYYYGASANSHRNLMAPYALQWNIIQEAKKRGCLIYDFLGISPEEKDQTSQEIHPWSGVTDFKKKFGGYSKKYPKAQEIIIKPFWYHVLKTGKGAKKLFR